MERADWLDEGYDPAEAGFLMVTAITHHRFNSPCGARRRSGSFRPSSPRSR
jgi:hypothetical protein